MGLSMVMERSRDTISRGMYSTEGVANPRIERRLFSMLLTITTLGRGAARSCVQVDKEIDDFWPVALINCAIFHIHRDKGHFYPWQSTARRKQR